MLSSVQFKSVMVYLEDIIIFWKNIKEHLGNVETLHSLLENAGRKIKLKKCFFIHDLIEYLCHILKPKELSFSKKTTYDV